MALSGLRRLGGELRHVVTGGYPRFVRSPGAGSSSAEYVPVFTFHTLEPRDFEAKLAYLAANGYRTLTLGELVSYLRREKPAPDRSVVLTVDDGRLTTWTVGLPLLQEYGMTATAFVVPAYLSEGATRPTIGDTAISAFDEEAFDERRDRTTTLRWSEARALAESAAVDVESHGFLHKQVPVSSEVVDFVTPDRRRAAFDVPMPVERSEPWSEEELRRRYGAPIFEHRSVLATETAVRPPVEATERCVTWVRRHGGEEFFQRRGWRRRLRALADRELPGKLPLASTESARRRELDHSRRVLEDRISGKRIRHFCLPRGEGLAGIGDLARETGHDSLLWGLLPDVRTNRPGCSPFAVERLKHDYLYRLPGEGRRSLARVFAAKSSRRLRGRTGY